MVDRTPAYAIIARHIRRSIRAETLAEGMVLFEGPLAEVFGSSRSPVKKALSILNEEGLLHRFNGRGFLVGRADRPVRTSVTREMLGLPQTAKSARMPAWRSIWYDFERDIILRAVFGEGRINELAVARHYGVGRTVARDLLTHAHDIGLVAKDSGSPWSLVPMDEQRFDNLYRLRLMLEPAAMESAAAKLDGTALGEMIRRCERAQISTPRIDGATLDEMETDLHITCISASDNPEITRALWHSRCMLVAGKHIQAAVGTLGRRIDPFMGEHVAVLDAARRGDAAGARKALTAHLESSRRKAKRRLDVFQSRYRSHDLEFVN